MGQRLIIVDLSGFIFRAFYAIRMLHSPEGTPVNAIHGVLGMLLKLIGDYKPTHLFIAKDSKELCFRKKMYPEYKANRTAPPEELVPQFELISELIDKMGLQSLKVDGYEADDVIGSAAVQWKNEFKEILIASNDKDLMQFVDNNIKMLDTMKDKIYEKEGVFEKMGVWPEQIVDYLSLLGDASDNIPGMKGVGAKGAAKLLLEHQTLERCILAKDSYTNKRVKNAFENYIDDALLSKKLITIETGIDLKVTPEKIKLEFNPTSELYSFLKGLGFKSALKKLKDLEYGDYQAKVNEKESEISSFFGSSSSAKDVKTICQINEIKDFDKIKELSLFFHYSDKNTTFNSLSSIGISVDGISAYVFFLNDLNNDEKKNLIKKIVEREDLTIIGFDLKKNMSIFSFEDFEFKSKYFDILQAYYNLDTGGGLSLPLIAQRYTDFILDDVNDSTPLEENSEEKARGIGINAIAMYHLSEKLQNDLKKQKLMDVYLKLDAPLIPILTKMERAGILLNVPFLESLEKEFSKKTELIENEIEEICDYKINLRSPKQVGELLFEKLNLPIIKKNKTGYSTNVEVLEELDSRAISDIPAKILKYRELEKLLSTYVKTLPLLVNKKTGRLHSHFNQHNVATGRLSSDNPNLQNIPVRTENGKLVRKGFIAKPGWVLLSADYSQIELRLLAHFSKDPVMVSAFKNDQDIHSQTASEVLSIPIKDVKNKERSIAKTVNFGLMYGQSSFGLSKTLKISRREAKEYITNYFSKFSRVKCYLDELKEIATENGYSKTLHGRKRFLPDLNAQNRITKSSAERLAVNSPIQGTAADIIKVSMIAIDRIIRERNLKSKLLLQVHDELIFEIPENEVAIMMDIVKKEMESAVVLNVPLKVDMGIGVNWFDLK